MRHDCIGLICMTRNQVKKTRVVSWHVTNSVDGPDVAEQAIIMVAHKRKNVIISCRVSYKKIFSHVPRAASSISAISCRVSHTTCVISAISCHVPHAICFISAIVCPVSHITSFISAMSCRVFHTACSKTRDT